MPAKGQNTTGNVFTPLRLSLAQREKFSNIWSLPQIMAFSTDGIEFEFFVGYLYEQGGYRVWTTPHTDYGIDLLVEKDGVRGVVQCKRYSSNLGLEYVMPLPGAMQDAEASYSVLVTTSRVTAPARIWANRGNKAIKLIEQPELIQWVRQVNRNYAPVVQKSTRPTPSSPFINFWNKARRLLREKRYAPYFAIGSILTFIVILVLIVNLVFAPGSAARTIQPAVSSALPAGAAGLDNSDAPVELTALPQTTTSAPVPTTTAAPTPTVRSINAASAPCFVGQVKLNSESKRYHEPGWPYYTAFGPKDPRISCADNALTAQAAGYSPSVPFTPTPRSKR